MIIVTLTCCNVPGSPQWFGFLKTGQAKETETLQESVLYTEVKLFLQYPPLHGFVFQAVKSEPVKTFVRFKGLKSVSPPSGSFGTGSDGQGREAGFSGDQGRPPPVHQRMVH